MHTISQAGPESNFPAVDDIDKEKARRDRLSDLETVIDDELRETKSRILTRLNS